MLALVSSLDRCVQVIQVCTGDRGDDEADGNRVCDVKAAQ